MISKLLELRNGFPKNPFHPAIGLSIFAFDLSLNFTVSSHSRKPDPKTLILATGPEAPLYEQFRSMRFNYQKAALILNVNPPASDSIYISCIIRCHST